MNVPYFCNDNFIDATNNFIGGSGGGGSGDISGGTSGDSLNNYIYLSSSNLIINNSNQNGEIRFKTLYNYPSYSSNIGVKIDSLGKLQVYHNYNITQPFVFPGYLNVEDEIAGAKNNNIVNAAEILVVQGQIAAIDSTLISQQTQITGIDQEVRVHQAMLMEDINSYNFFKDITTFGLDFNVATAQAQAIANIARRGEIMNNLAIGGAFAWGTSIIAGIYNMMEMEQMSNSYQNLQGSGITTNNRRLGTSNFQYYEKVESSNFITNLSNGLITTGFINSNIITSQTIPSLKSNKIMLGNITTPNESYQMEMTGDLNLNQLYLNSTSLTSLLNQKQNNITAVSPLYLTTGNIGINYDSSLTKIGNNLSVVKTATAPLNWTGNDIALSFDNTLINNAGSLGLSIAAESKWAFSGDNIYNKALTNVGIGTNSGLTSKLNVIGDIYCSSNINIGTSNLPSFNGSFFNVAVNSIVDDERYLQYLVDGSLTLNEPTTADILMVGAGGYGGTGAGSGGGGAGEVIYYPNFPLPRATMTIQVGYVDPNSSLRRSRIFIPSGNTLMTALGGGDGGTSIFYTTSGGTVSALTPIAGTNDAYISITAGTTLTLSANCSADILVVGGGGGGSTGGGGAGQVVYQTNQTLNSGSYTITIGAGGAGVAPNSLQTTRGNDGNDSVIQLAGNDIIRARKGGGGAGNTLLATAPSPPYGSTGGNGINSGGGQNTFTAGTVLGFVGGVSGVGTSYNSAGGGGGAGEIGQPGTAGDNSTLGSGSIAGRGGNGIIVPITGTNVYYGGGGGGGTNINNTTGNTILNRPAGGLGGGGEGSRLANEGGLSATANTGGGGGGGDWEATTAGNGGSGIVIIRFKNYLTIMAPTSGGSGGGGAKNQTGAAAGTKFDEYKSFSLAGLNGTSTTGGNGGSGNTIYNTRYTTNITGTPISVGLGGSGVGNSPAAPATKSNYGDGGDGNGGSGFKGIVIIRFKKASTNLHLRAIKDNANTGLILNANEVVSGTINPYQLRIFPWSDTYTTTGIPTRGWSFRCHDGAANLDLINLFSFFGGRVGIKTKNPGAVLDVNGDIQCKTFNITGNEQYGISCQITNQNAIGEAAFVMYAGQGTNYGGLSLYYLPTENLGYISCSKNLRIKTGNDAANSYIHIDNSTGNIGIGNNAPSYKLVVNGTIGANDIIVSGSINATTLGIGQVYATGIDNGYFNNLNGTITNNKFLFSSNIYINNFIDCQNKPIYNCSYLYGGSSWTNELFLYTNIYHKDDQGRERIYFKNDTTGSPANHFTLFKSGGTTHAFSDKDDVQYCLLERFGITAYYEVISGGGYDAVSVLDASSTGTYVYRKMYVKLNSFTEVHRCFCEDPFYTNYNDFINEFLGRIVISKGKIKTVLKQPDEPWKILEGKDGITIDDSHPMVELSRKINDKRVIGVITKRENSQDMENRLVINSLGETAVWIVNSSGNIQNGDLITTSNEIGYGQLQLDSNGMPDEIIKNYTIGKCMIDCNFELDSNEYKCEIIDETRNLRRAFLPIFVYSG